ncbi:hypothetical protein CJF32_00004841 [Rutstroemia sp. NJR-2017a WRK4]|nr:hypothetical protein CJF32_00004841 [Rutstroemia sp. NJR-2017a WRK4]
MLSQQWSSRKRDRDDEDDFATSSFSAHRSKRHIASLPHRTSPHAKPQTAPSFSLNYPIPAPPTITPTDSDSEEATWASTPIVHVEHNDASYPNQIGSSQSTQMSEGPAYSDDFEMTDSGMHLSPGPFQPDHSSTTLASRIPTPIHSSFAYLPPNKTLYHSSSDPDFTTDEALIDRFRRGRRLPSPISEGEMSPSVIVEGMNGMQMEVEPSEPSPETSASPPMKKGHTRSKHSLRNWHGCSSELGGNINILGMKRTFSMGYRADCEKCRNKVPGHFSHIITY